jgi:hypothetical protein
MTHYRVAKRILCFVVAAVLLCMPAALPGLWAKGAAVPLGQSTVSTDAAFMKVLADSTIGFITIQGNINGASLNWAVVQKGSKTIAGATGAEKLTLPPTLSAGGPLSFDKLVLARANPTTETVIFANSNAFRFGPEIAMAEQFIAAIYGGSNAIIGTSTDITLESGVVGRIYCGGYNTTMTGGASVTIAGKAVVGGIYGAYDGSVIPNAKTVTLKNFGAATAYADTIPTVSGVEIVRLENTYLRRRDWNGLVADRVDVAANSVLWLDGGMAVGSSLLGEGGGLMITGGSDIWLANTAAPLSGKFALSLSGGGGAWLRGGGAYQSCLTAPDTLYLSGNPDLLIQQITIGSIGLASPPKTAYFRGDSLQTTGGMVRIHYLPVGVPSRDIPLTTDMVSGYDSSRVGSQTLTVTYEGKMTTYIAWIADPDIARLSLDTIPRRTTYTLGDDLRLSGGKVEARYRNGSRMLVAFTDSSVQVDGYDAYQPGRQILSVYYNGQPAGNYRVTVNEEESSASESTSSRGTIADDDRTVNIRGLPRDTVVEVGESFTLSAFPYRGGNNWSWETTHFTCVDEGGGAVTFTALREGKGSISYADDYAETSVTLTIIDGKEEPPPESAPTEESRETSVIAPDAMIPAPALPGGASTPQTDMYVPSVPEEPASTQSSEEEESAFEESSEEPVDVPVFAPSTEPMATETAPSGAEIPANLPNRLPLAVVGVGAAAVMLIVGVVCVWRFSAK